MPRPSVLVYELLRREQPRLGFSSGEILRLISARHKIAPGKTLRRQITAALRCGLDYGVIARERNRYRYQPSPGKTVYESRGVAATSRSGDRKKGGGGKSRRKIPRKRRKSRREERPSRSSEKPGRRDPVRKPRLPDPPGWTPKRRHLAKEPIPRFIKHS